MKQKKTVILCVLFLATTLLIAMLGVSHAKFFKSFKQSFNLSASGKTNYAFAILDSTGVLHIFNRSSVHPKNNEAVALADGTSVKGTVYALPEGYAPDGSRAPDTAVAWSTLQSSDSPVLSVVVQDSIKMKNGEGLFENFASCTDMNLLKLDSSEMSSTSRMFGECTQLATVTVKQWDIDNAAQNMFEGCSAIVLNDRLPIDGTNFTVSADKSTLTLNGYNQTTHVAAIVHGNVTHEAVSGSQSNFDINSPTAGGTWGDHCISLKAAKKYAFATLSSDGTHLQIYNRVNSVNSTFVPDNMTNVTVYKYPNTLVNNSVTSAPSGSSQPENVTASWDTLSSKYGSGAYEGALPSTLTSKVKTITVVDNVKPASASTYAPPWFLNMTAVTTINGLDKMDVSSMRGMSCMFRDCRVLTSLDLSAFNTSKVQVFYRMFYNCYALKTLDVSNFQTVTESGVGMQEMFRNCTSLSSIKFGTGFSTKNFSNLRYMFYRCESLQSIDVDFDISGSNIEAMFAYCSKLTKVGTHDGTGARLYFNGSKSIQRMSMIFYSCSSLPSLSFEGSVNTSECTSMESAFYYCASLERIDGITKFDTSNVTSMNNMFSAIAKIKVLDLSSFNTAKVTNMGAMFYCSSEQGANSQLTTIYVGEGWTNANAEASTNVFDNCLNLVGGQGTKYDVSRRGVEYARVDGGTDAPGYFTFKSSTAEASDDNGDTPT